MTLTELGVQVLTLTPQHTLYRLSGGAAGASGIQHLNASVFAARTSVAVQDVQVRGWAGAALHNVCYCTMYVLCGI